MILEYILRLLLLVPIVGALAWGSLWLWKRVHGALPAAGNNERLIRTIEVLPMTPGSKLAVIEFGGKQHLIAITRNGIGLIACDDRGDFHAP